MSLISLFKRKNRKILFTTPSHNQNFFIFNKFRQLYKYDISETDAHAPETALLKAEQSASKIYGTISTHFLTNGSTSGIIAAVLACTSPNDKILIWDNAHMAHCNAVELAGCKPIFYSLNQINNWDIPDKIDVCQFENLLKMYSPKATIITSPSYEGIVCDIKSIAQICKKHNTFLIVDEAHGALYPFSDKLPTSAVKIADYTIQSLHKTAGGLNPTALLHCNCKLSPTSALKKISTTSPSYPLLATIEANINYLKSAKCKNKIDDLIITINDMKLDFKNIEFSGDDPLKILIKHKNFNGVELSEKLFNEFNIEDEKTNNTSTMLLCGVGTTIKKINSLERALNKLDKL
ncbi:MAG: aminotransferase class I/II-fold pyridoxal phosphate-dependent enzyme [Candidatus Gastranaerophilales bacterium]